MFQHLDTALSRLLDVPATQVTLPQLVDADTSFETPDRHFVPLTDLTVNLFLYEVKENVALRAASPRMDLRADGLSARRRAPTRVDCSYLVTAWAKKPPKTQTEHQLLGEALNWLNRFPVIPVDRLVGTGLDDQEFAPPTLAAQMDGAKSAGEFWVALGIAPRPYFNLMVTLTMDLDQVATDTLVTTVSTGYGPVGALAAGDERIVIGGTVRAKSGRAVPGAWVRMEPEGLTVLCDAQGRFVFQRVRQGPGKTLRARAPGFIVEAQRAGLEVPSLSGEYDLTFPT